MISQVEAACKAVADVPWSVWLFWLFFGFALRVLRKSADPKYALRYLIVGADEKPDQHKLITFCGFLGSLWAFVHYSATYKTPEWMFTAFFVGCVLPQLFVAWLNRGSSLPPASGSSGNQPPNP